MDFVACKISLGGDAANILYRGSDRPVSWPEVRVLQYLHGEENVFDCEFVRSEHAVTQAEKMRLLGLYGAEPVNICYPGARPMMDMDFPGDKEPLAVMRPQRRLVADIEPGKPPVEEPAPPQPPEPEPQPPSIAAKAKRSILTNAEV